MSLMKINLAEKLVMFDSRCDHHIIANYNGNDVMVVKFTGEFPFHKHDTTDDFFLILEGEVTMDGADGDAVTLGAGVLCVVPKGMVHRPRAVSEAKVLLIEPTGEPNSGDSDRPPASKPSI